MSPSEPKTATFTPFTREIPLDKEIIAKSFTIESSLFQAVSDQQESSRLAADFADIFSWDIDFYLFPAQGRHHPDAL